MSDNLSNDLCSLVPDKIYEYRDGSTVAVYGDFLVVTDSESQLTIWEVPDEVSRNNLFADCQLNDAEKWAIWEADGLLINKLVDEDDEDYRRIKDQYPWPQMPFGEFVVRNGLGLLAIEHATEPVNVEGDVVEDPITFMGIEEVDGVSYAVYDVEAVPEDQARS